MKYDIKNYLNLENEFFDLDDENKIAKMKLHFASPNDIFDSKLDTKTPILTDEFRDWIANSFDLAPKKYKISLDITFDDMAGYKEDELHDIFVKNCGLEFKKSERQHKFKAKIGYSLFGIGILFLIAIILITALWTEDKAIKEIIIGIVEIASWVTIWEALDIFIIENSERHKYMKSLAKRFTSITFHKK